MQYVSYPEYQHISYPIGENMEEAIRHTKSMADAFKQIDEFDGKDLKIFCRGSSGAILAALFLSSLNWPKSAAIHHVLKDGEKTHRFNMFIVNPSDVVIIIDDVIVSGETLKNIYRHIPNREIDCLILSDYTCIRELVRKTGFIPKYFIGLQE